MPTAWSVIHAFSRLLLLLLLAVEVFVGAKAALFDFEECHFEHTHTHKCV